MGKMGLYVSQISELGNGRPCQVFEFQENIELQWESAQAAMPNSCTILLPYFSSSFRAR